MLTLNSAPVCGPHFEEHCCAASQGLILFVYSFSFSENIVYAFHVKRQLDLEAYFFLVKLVSEKCYVNFDFKSKAKLSGSQEFKKLSLTKPKKNKKEKEKKEKCCSVDMQLCYQLHQEACPIWLCPSQSQQSLMVGPWSIRSLRVEKWQF